MMKDKKEEKESSKNIQAGPDISSGKDEDKKVPEDSGVKAQQENGNVVISRKEYEDIKAKAKEKEAIWDKYLRLYADSENARRMWDRQRGELLQFGNFRIMKEFTSVLDEIESALANLQKEDSEHTKGLNMIYKKIKDILLKEGVKVIETEGKLFDPNFHEALLFQERGDLPEHSIIEVIQQGYSYGDKVLRPAKVRVSVKPQAQEEEQKTEDKS
jgi:molecular chaperone GrpE